MPEMRTFAGGATRDTDTTKPEYAGFLSPLTIKRFGAYMHAHRIQSDGSLRSSRNWRKGIPVPVYEESLMRHMVDVWLHLEGFEAEANEPLEEALCGMLFNVGGLLHETILKRLEAQRGRTE